MKKKYIKLYDAIFPVWILLLWPKLWLAVLPANFLIDLVVVVLTLRCLGIKDIMQNAKSVIVKVWLYGLAADVIGAAAMLFNPQAYTYNIYTVLWITGCVIISAFFIFRFNYKYSLETSSLDNSQKQKLALVLAVLTAPYMFFIPA
ncbi:MAG: hypothetical protein PHW26_07135 [Eubacteriales bacterium]|nr:hypothetical protein [Eubacteriales bacterium]